MELIYIYQNIDKCPPPLIKKISGDFIMTARNTPKINVRNSVIERAQSLKKENIGNTTATALKAVLPQ